MRKHFIAALVAIASLFAGLVMFASPASALEKGITCGTNNANYKAVFIVDWWASGSVSGTNFITVSFQKKNASGVWAEYNWASTMTERKRYNASVIDTYGPTNPAAHIEFIHLPEGQTANSTFANEYLTASGGGVTLNNCVQYSPYG